MGKISYERHAYKLVSDRSLSYAIAISKMTEEMSWALMG